LVAAVFVLSLCWLIKFGLRGAVLIAGLIELGSRRLIHIIADEPVGSGINFSEPLDLIQSTSSGFL
jgi:hypothetical protein